MKTAKIIEALLNGAFISKRKCRRKGFSYALYGKKQIVIQAISDIQFSTLKHVFKEKKGRYTFNLNLVRQMHGKSLPKKMYKQSKQKQHVTPADSAAA